MSIYFPIWGATAATHRFYKAAFVVFVLQVKELSGPGYIFLKNKLSRAALLFMAILKFRKFKLASGPFNSLNEHLDTPHFAY